MIRAWSQPLLKIQATLNMMNSEKVGVAHVIGLRRLYCNRNGVFLMVDVPASNVEAKKAKLILKGWLIEDDILV